MSVQTHIDAAFQFRRIKPYQPGSGTSLEGTFSDYTQNAVSHGVHFKELNWTFDSSRTFQSLLQLELDPNKWRSIEETVDVDGVDNLYNHYQQLRTFSLGMASDSDSGHERFVESNVKIVLEYVGLLLQAAMVQIVNDAGSLEDEAEFRQFLQYIQSLTIESRSTIDGQPLAIPDMLIKLDGVLLGTFELKGTRFNHRPGTSSPTILAEWMSNRKDVIGPITSTSTQEAFAWSIVAQLAAQALLNRSKMGFFTTLIGTLRIYRYQLPSAPGKPGTFWVTPNLGPDDNVQNRSDRKTLVSFTRYVLAYIYMLLLDDPTIRDYLSVNKAWNMDEMFAEAQGANPAGADQDFYLRFSRYRRRMMSDIILATPYSPPIGRILPFTSSAEVLERFGESWSDRPDRCSTHLFFIPFPIAVMVLGGQVLMSPNRGLVFKFCSSFRHIVKLQCDDSILRGNAYNVAIVIEGGNVPPSTTQIGNTTCS
ncbi:hypothetical protein CPB83DRAFT_863332, partial [Crepidotus variabilis]